MKLKECLLTLLFLSLLFPIKTAFAQDAFSEPLEKVRVVRAEHLVSVRLLGFVRQGSIEDTTTLELELRTRAGVHLYTKNLNFTYAEEGGFDRSLSYTGDPAPISQYDNWYKEVRSFFVAGTIFRVGDGKQLSTAGFLKMRFEACNIKLCLMPATYRFAMKPGAIGVPEVALEGEFAPPAAVAPSPTPISAAENPPVEESSLSTQANRFLQRELSKGGLLLLPLLFLAGLAMNLTPCVYPMIPITLSVLGRFGRARKTSEKLGSSTLLPFAYVLGIALTYSLMGVVAGMTGGLFGSLLQNTAVNIGVAILMVFMGLAMLGVFDLSSLQNIGGKIPLSEKSPVAAVFVMGGVSGLVSAPCTGPVLASLLILVGQTRDPLQGFLLLFVFSLGFGSPYLALGTLTQKVGKLPRIGILGELVKYAFSALMFALAIYYLRGIFGKFGLSFLYVRPSQAAVVGAVLVALLAAILSFRFLGKEISRRVAGALSILLVTSSTVLALWLTLWALKAFPTASQIHWIKNWDEAMRLASSEHRPLVVDLWADWCASCKEMDATLWNDPEVVDVVEREFIAVKLDFTEESNMTRWFTQSWELGGLPAVGFFVRGADLQVKPQKLFREKLEKDLFLKTAAEFSQR